MAKSLERTHREETKLFGYNARAAVALKRFTELNKERETKAQENDRILREKRCLHFGVFYAAPPHKPMREFKKKILSSLSPRAPCRYMEHILQHRATAKTYDEEIHWAKCDKPGCNKWRKSLSDVRWD